MTIKWGDPIECNGVRPDWLRGHVPFEWSQDGVDFTPSALGDPEGYDWSDLTAFRLPADHPAYVALARGFHPWSGGDSAPDDWDGGAVLLRDGTEWGGGRHATHWFNNFENLRAVIGYRKRVEYGAVHTDRSRSGGQPPRYDRLVEADGVFIKRMTKAEAADLIDTVNGSFASLSQGMALLRRLGLVQDESRAERFTRETGHAVTEAVEAALNWKGE